MSARKGAKHAPFRGGGAHADAGLSSRIEFWSRCRYSELALSGKDAQNEEVICASS